MAKSLQAAEHMGFLDTSKKNEQNREGRERMEELKHRQKAEGLPSSLCFLVLSL